MLLVSMAGPDYIVDIDGLTEPSTDEAAQTSTFVGPRRPWLAVRWRCCGVYSRVYRNRGGEAYEGRCPRCQRPLRVAIGPGGTTARFFEAS